MQQGKIKLSHSTLNKTKTMAITKQQKNRMPASMESPIDIDSQLQLFVDRFIIDILDDVELRLQQPVRLPKPNLTPLMGDYIKVIKDGDLYRAYWRDNALTYIAKDAHGEDDRVEFYRYAESRNGHEWEYPKLGLYEIDGSSSNNVIFKNVHNFSPFLDARPGSTKYERLFTEAFIRPGLDPERWGNRANYVALNVVPTGPAEMSIYHQSGHRYVLRTDGFVSVHAGAKEGSLLTRQFKFTGRELLINYSTSASGSIQVEIQDEKNQPIPGFRLMDCASIIGVAGVTSGEDKSLLEGIGDDTQGVAGGTTLHRDG